MTHVAKDFRTAATPTHETGSLTARLARHLRAMRDRAATRRALADLDAKHLRDIGLTAHDRDALTGTPASGLDTEDLAQRAGVRAGNW